MKFQLIVNPKAGAGAASRRVEQLKRGLERRGIAYGVHLTRAPGDATRLARLSRESGADVVVVVGGDGTLNEVAQAYLGEDGEPLEGPSLALISAGTGGDFRRTLGTPQTPDEALDHILKTEPRPFDLGVVDLTGDGGKPVRKAFVNITSFWIAGRIDRIVNDSPKWIGGRAAFFTGTLRAMAVYQNAAVEVRVDGRDWFQGRIVNVAIANGKYFGGGMKVAPNAEPSDGWFDVVALGDMTFAESLALTGKIYRGTHLTAPKVQSTRGRLVEASPKTDRPVLIDLDGEAPGRLPLTARVAAGALRIRA